MARDYIEKQDNLLTKKECADIIQWVGNKKKIYSEKFYDFCDFMEPGENFEQCFSPVPLNPLYKSIIKLKDSYRENNPEVDRLGCWDIEYVRFKWWKPGKFYNAWHSEHMPEHLSRVMSFLIYLTDNDCCTEFRNYKNVPTKAGRGIMFPAYFTHEHRGSPCQKGLDRFIVSGYFSFTHG